MVIDAKTFAASYNAFWRSTAPMCDLFVRRHNLDGYERWDAPIETCSGTERRALIAEFGFCDFVMNQRIACGAAEETEIGELNQLIWAEATRRLTPYRSDGLDLDTPFDEVENREAVEISSRLQRFFGQTPKSIVTRPLFPGCGFVDQSEGDAIAGKTLYEVKTVDRSFRVVDFRQLLTYSALNHISDAYDLTSIGIFNPRRGIYCEIELDELSIKVSGKPASVLLPDIVDALASGEISR